MCYRYLFLLIIKAKDFISQPATFNIHMAVFLSRILICVIFISFFSIVTIYRIIVLYVCIKNSFKNVVLHNWMFFLQLICT